MSSSSPSTLEDATVLLSDAKLLHVARIHTGLVDHVFGGGVVPTSVCLLAGEPGSGKTTLCLQLADVLARVTTKEVLYIANEQDANELKTTADRLALKHLNRIRVVKAMGGISFDIGELLLHFKPGAIFLDSVTKWAGEDMSLAVNICERLKDYTVRLGAPSIVVNQINKSGEHAGLMKMQHAVDMTAVFEILEADEGKKSHEALRHLYSTKNRFGPAPEEQFFHMGEHGLSHALAPEDSEDSEDEEHDH